MRRLRITLLSFAALIGALIFALQVPVEGQASQIQAALRQFLATANTWTATQTFGNVIVGGTCSGCTGTGAPLNATYLTQTANATLLNEQAVGALSSGIMRVATTTGVVTSLTNSAGIAANISDETGTGALVFGTAPTLTTSLTVTGHGSFTTSAINNDVTLTLNQNEPGPGADTILALNAVNDSPYAIFLQNATNSRSAGIYLGNDGTLAFDSATSFGFGAAVAVTYNPTTAAPTTLNTTSEVDNGVSGYFDINKLFGSYLATDRAATDAFSTLIVSTAFGDGTHGAVGTAQNLNSFMSVAGSGSADNEYGGHLNALRIDIGTGYTQSTGPVGRAWLGDWSLLGPIGVRPDTLNGLVLLANNTYNGSPADSASGGVWLTTVKGGGAGSDALHQAANTYAMDVALGITGVSDVSGTTGVGWTTGIQIGGTGSPWGEVASKIGTGIHIRDYTSGGILIDNPSGSPANGALKITPLASMSGTRYLCIGTTGIVTSSATACSGT